LLKEDIGKFIYPDVEGAEIQCYDDSKGKIFNMLQNRTTQGIKAKYESSD
jgi:hypothetical protein